jgi:hypothetical protein
MKRLYLTVEGQTEAAFALTVLQPHLSTFGVMMHRPRFTGPHARRRGRVPAGGMFNRFVHTLGDIRRWLKEDKSSDARFSMMVDFYSLPADFPGYATAMAMSDAPSQVIALEQALAHELSDDRFVPYLQLHEFEALVLVEPKRLAELYDVRAHALEELCDQCAGFDSPEHINLGQHSHPKYRIQQSIPEYDQNVAGPLLTERIGLWALRRRCPHFDQWLTRLETLDK